MKKSFKNLLLVVLTVLALTVSALGGTPVRAASSNAGTPAELIAAIIAANASAADDIITLTADITLTAAYDGSSSGLPKLLGTTTGGKLTIEGDGFKISRNPSAGDFRILETDYEVNLTLNNLTMENGVCPGCNGGALSVDGGSTVTITNSTFAGHQSDWGGALYIYESTLNMTNSKIGYNLSEYGGGGLYASGSTLTITDSYLSMNGANESFGGGIYSQYGTMTITGTTLSNNMSSSSTVTNSKGGGIYNFSNTLTVTNSTLKGNTAEYGGGIYNNASNLTLKNNTLSGNSAKSGGGGINNFEGTTGIINTIIANSDLGGECVSSGTGATVNAQNSLIEDSLTCVNGTNTNNLTGDPNLDTTLKENGGPTQTLALLSPSTAINAGNDGVCAANPVNGLDQRGAPRPSGDHCDIGAFEYGYVLITGNADIAGTTLTYTDGVERTVTAGETGGYTLFVSYNWSGTVTPSMTGYEFTPASTPYTNVVTNQTDQDYTAAELPTFTISGNAGVAGAILSYLDGTNKTATADGDGHYSFTVYKNWTGRVTPSKTGYVFSPAFKDYPAVTSDQTAQDYTATARITFTSAAAQDGWVLESSEISKKGGSLNATDPTLRLGDDKLKKQYLGILSFATGAKLPDNAVITSVTLKVKKHSITGGGDPLTTFQGFMVDIKKGFFGTTALQAADFQTLATKSFGPFKPAISSGWYSINLTSGKANINKLNTSSGLTQIRLRFNLDDNNNALANYLSLFSGNAPAESRPQLTIQYTMP